MKLFREDNGISYYELNKDEIEVFHYFREMIMKKDKDIDIDDILKLVDGKMYILMDNQYKIIGTLIEEVLGQISEDEKFIFWTRTHKLKKIQSNLD